MISPFRLYLNSDEDSLIYTHNTPSHFKTYFTNPIELQGSWKVALENISYSSHIKTQPASVKIRAIPAHEKAIWTKHPFQYRLSEDECWLGYSGVQPSNFKEPLTSVDSVLKALNALNDLILCDGEKRKMFGNVFRFSQEAKTGRVIYECFDANFTLRMRTWLSEALGFEHRNMFIGDETQTANKPFDNSARLTADAFKVIYFNKKLQLREKRIMIKEKGKRVENNDDMHALWKQTVESYMPMLASFKERKLVIRSHAWGTFFTASPDFCETFGYPSTFLIGEQWALTPPIWEKDNTDQEWYIDVYSTHMAFEKDVSQHYMTIPLYPWQCKTLAEVVHRINHKVDTHLKHVLKQEYSEKQHAFQFSIATSETTTQYPFTLPKDRACLLLGQRLNATFSENVTTLFAFSQAHCNRKFTISNQDVGKHVDEEETISLRCSLSEKPFPKFTHQRTDASCVNTWFDNPTFIPMKENMITAVTCELHDSTGKLLDINERPTMITLKCCKQT